jgi:hypothetical protein
MLRSRFERLFSTTLQTGAVIDLLNCTFRENFAVSSGGGFHANVVSFAARKCSFVSNIAVAAGGGGALSLRLGANVLMGGLAVVEDVMCDSNEAATGGCLSWNLEEDGEGMMFRGALTANKARSFGGAMSVLYTVPRLTPMFSVVDASFHTNVVTPKSSLDAGHGGAIFVYPSVFRWFSKEYSTTPFYDDSNYYLNPISAYHVHIVGCTFDGNEAKSGSGGGVAISRMGSVDLDNSIIHRCEAMDGGGVAALDSALLRISGGTLLSCSASSSGGGVFSGTEAIVTLADSVLDNCTAWAQGGGVATTGTSVLAMVHTTVRNSRAAFRPGAAAAFIGGGTAAAASATANGGGCYPSGEGLFVG